MTLHIPKYCPECGTKYPSVPKEVDEIHCSHCRHIHYLNAAGVANLIVPHAGGIFIQQRGIQPGRSLWGLPGGFMKPFESWQRSSARETDEEIAVIIADPDRNIEPHFFDSSTHSNTLVVFGKVRAGASVVVSQFSPHREVLRREILLPQQWPAFRDQFAFTLHKLAIDSYFKSL
jgi:ADP-ribose pyrophosphatase YjhB (NUDIX family)